MRDKKVFIFGAGASYDFGVPLMSNFIETATDLAIQNKFTNNSDILKLLKTIRNLRSIYAKSQIDLNNLETMLGLFEMAKTISFKFSGLKHNQIINLYIQMIIETIEITSKILYKDRFDIRLDACYNKLIHRLGDRLESSTFITFNYDLGLDFALYNNNKKIEYHLEESDNKGTSLLKLHGSINWAKSGKEVKAITFDDYFSHFTYRANEKYLPIRFQFFNLLKSFDTIFKKKHIPFIVPPSWNKSNYHNQIVPVWKKAYQELASANTIVILGYSLPETDVFFKYLYSLSSNSETIIKKIVLVDPNKEVEFRFRNLLGPEILNSNKFYPYQQSFKDFLSNGLDQIG